MLDIDETTTSQQMFISTNNGMTVLHFNFISQSSVHLLLLSGNALTTHIESTMKLTTTDIKTSTSVISTVVTSTSITTTIQSIVRSTIIDMKSSMTSIQPIVNSTMPMTQSLTTGEFEQNSTSSFNFQKSIVRFESI